MLQRIIMNSLHELYLWTDCNDLCLERFCRLMPFVCLSVVACSVSISSSFAGSVGFTDVLRRDSLFVY